MSDQQPTTLKAWYYLTELTATSELIKARFLPDVFQGWGLPVLTIVVERPSEQIDRRWCQCPPCKSRKYCPDTGSPVRV